jgi:hypothetical protein
LRSVFETDQELLQSPLMDLNNQLVEQGDLPDQNLPHHHDPLLVGTLRLQVLAHNFVIQQMLERFPPGPQFIFVVEQEPVVGCPELLDGLAVF